MGLFSSTDLQVITYHRNCSSTIRSTFSEGATISLTWLVGFKNAVFTGSFFQARQTRGPSNRTGEPEDHKYNSENKILNREITENRVNKSSKLELKVALQGFLPFVRTAWPDQSTHKENYTINIIGNELLLNFGKNFQN